MQRGPGGRRWPRRERLAGRRRVAVRGFFSRCIGLDLGAPDTRPRGTSGRDWGHPDQWPEAHALQWSELFPVFPVDWRLFPVPPGTENLNHINGLRSIFRFVPGVPGKSGRHPEGSSRAARHGAVRCRRIRWRWWASCRASLGVVVVVGTGPSPWAHSRVVRAPFALKPQGHPKGVPLSFRSHANKAPGPPHALLHPGDRWNESAPDRPPCCGSSLDMPLRVIRAAIVDCFTRFPRGVVPCHPVQRPAPRSGVPDRQHHRFEPMSSTRDHMPPAQW